MGSVEILGLTKRFNGLLAVDNISLSIEKGEIFRLLGPNGAGKTTTIRMLVTLLTPTSGTARVNGFDIIKEPMQVRETLGMIEQEAALEGRLSAFENMKFQARVYHVDSKETDRNIIELLKLIGLKGREHDLVNTYSGGMKRRLEIIKAILHKPKIIFMDEPTLGLDTQTRVKVWEHIKSICKKEKSTIFLTRHYIDEADYLCDRVAIIDRGKLIALDTPKNLKKLVGGNFILDISVNEKDISRLEGMIKRRFKVKTKRVKKNSIHVISENSELLPKVITQASAHGIEIKHLSLKEPSLEDVFIHLTGKEIREVSNGTGEGLLRGRS